jgi:hypothetical protein
MLCFFQEFLFNKACNTTGVVLYHIMKDFNFVKGGLGGFCSKKELLDGLYDECWPLLSIRVVSLIPLRLSILMMDVSARDLFWR